MTANPKHRWRIFRIYGTSAQSVKDEDHDIARMFPGGLCLPRKESTIDWPQRQCQREPDQLAFHPQALSAST
jgi:hypothetical protein